MTWGAKDPGSKKEDRKREKDRKFLAKLQTATIEELRVIHGNHKHKGVPTWKKIAITRAFLRFPP